MEQLAKYKNGNTIITIMDDGTKIREYERQPNICHPESIDVKITDYCDLGCQYCHESSTTKGKHADLSILLTTLNSLQAGVELALGGGNPLSHPELISFLFELKKQGLIINLTVNQGHLKTYCHLITYLIKEDLIKGLGISITSNNFKYIKQLKTLTSNIVYHIIAGVNNTSILDTLIDIGECKALILGYKQFGFGVNFFSKSVEQSVLEWKNKIRYYFGKCTLSFDNLAIEQLDIKRHFTHEGWNKFYMGDDFTFTMYIDAVKQEYAPTSRSNKRTSFNNYSLMEYFILHKK